MWYRKVKTCENNIFLIKERKREERMVTSRGIDGHENMGGFGR